MGILKRNSTRRPIYSSYNICDDGDCWLYGCSVNVRLTSAQHRIVYIYGICVHLNIWLLYKRRHVLRGRQNKITETGIGYGES